MVQEGAVIHPYLLVGAVRRDLGVVVRLGGVWHWEVGGVWHKGDGMGGHSALDCIAMMLC